MVPKGMSSTSAKQLLRRDKTSSRQRPGCEALEARTLLAQGQPFPVVHPPSDIFVPSKGDVAITAATVQPGTQLSAKDVQDLLDRASAASPSRDGIIAIVDRGGRILGVRAESGVSPTIMNDPEKLTFAVDGALALARTGAFFASDQAPLTARTIQDISQSTITEREVKADPNIPDPNSTLRGPGFVSPIGIKGHFPPGVPFTPQVDLFQIEHTNRDGTVNPGADHIRGTPDDITLANRFNVPTQFIPTTIFNPANPAQPDLRLSPPDSYGFVSGLFPNAQARGIGTLPGGLPIERTVMVNGKPKSIDVGGIGVFYPGTTGFASEENSSISEGYDPTKRDRSIEAELVAFAAVGGATNAQVLVGRKTTFGAIGGVNLPNNLDLLPGPIHGQYKGRIDLVGITLDVFGPNGNQGPIDLFKAAPKFGIGAGTVNGVDLPISPTAGAPLTRPGQIVPEGWLVTPHDGIGISAADVVKIVADGIAQSNLTRAAIRLPLNRHARMVFAVADETGAILGLFRMPDATIFSIDVAVSKARNIAYYNNANQLQPIDQVPGLPPGTAITSRTIRFLSLPHFPEGIDVYPSGPFSILNDGGTSFASNAAIVGPRLPASAYQSVQGFDSFNPGTNFRAPTSPANQSGVVFFPGGVGIYKPVNGQSTLLGAIGVSGDGVDQDDVVTFAASEGFRPDSPVVRSDFVKIRGVRLPYQKFNRQPFV